MYEGESDESMTSSIPFIPIPEEEEMPKVLFIFESRETGAVEPGPEGEELSVTELELHQYADMAILKEKLDEENYDRVRAALGLESMASALSKGVKISERILSNVQS
jgi:hypothetical protein